MTRMAKAVTLVTAILLMVVASGCGGNDNSSSTYLVPQRATFVGTIKVGEIRDAFDLDLGGLVKIATSSSITGAAGLDDFFPIGEASLGIDYRDVSRVDIFGEGSATEEKSYFGATVYGSFDEPAVIAEIETVSGRKLVKEKYKGSDVYSPVENPDEIMFSVLDSGTFAVGTSGALHDIIDLRAGDAESASGPLIDAFNDLEGEAFQIAVKGQQGKIIEGGLASLPVLESLPFSLDFLSSAEIFGLSAGLIDDSTEFTASIDFTDEEDAAALNKFIGGIAALASSFTTSPLVGEVLAGMEVAQEGRRLIIKVNISKSELPGLLSSMTAISSESTSGETPQITLHEAVVGDEIALMPSANHVQEGQKVDYSTTPPTSGMHWGRWAKCGWYPDGQPDEVTTHNLEHGNIVVSYNFANPAQVTELRQVLDGVAQFKDWGVARAYDKIPEGQVALAAWGRLDTIQGVSAPEIESFFEAFAGLMGPETVAC
ncbi:MAG: DUF3105 domain-containing protein [SAR202 cluster bacterium]|nr:DUF3105 domain-containing protein [SAR202 cluster bacterium]